MYFSHIYSVPANTTAQVPSHQKLKIANGTIKQWFVYGPDEKADMLHVSIEYHSLQMIPFGGQRWMYPLDFALPIEENIVIKDSPYVLDIYAYNEDDSYAHEYIFGVVVIPEKPVSVPPATSQSVIDRLKQLFGG